VLLVHRPVAAIFLGKEQTARSRAIRGTGTRLAAAEEAEEDKEMKRLTLILATAGAVLAASHALASDWKAQPLAVKRQMVSQVIACMKKRMSNDRLMSYNQASKACRETVEGQLEKSTAGPLVAADTGAAK
jgi:hypothetical protein